MCRPVEVLFCTIEKDIRIDVAVHNKENDQEDPRQGHGDLFTHGRGEKLFPLHSRDLLGFLMSANLGQARPKKHIIKDIVGKNCENVAKNLLIRL
jgi:hypothetical protein